MWENVQNDHINTSFAGFKGYELFSPILKTSFTALKVKATEQFLLDMRKSGKVTSALFNYGDEVSK